MAIQTSVAAEPMSYPMTEEDRDIKSRARALADELIPHEVEAEMNEGRRAPEVERRHEGRARELGFGAPNRPKEVGGGGFTAWPAGPVPGGERAGPHCRRRGDTRP